MVIDVAIVSMDKHMAAEGPNLQTTLVPGFGELDHTRLLGALHRGLCHSGNQIWKFALGTGQPLCQQHLAQCRTSASRGTDTTAIYRTIQRKRRNI